MPCSSLHGCYHAEICENRAAVLVVFIGDDDDWRHWRQVGDEVLHIELRRWADALIIAPLSANSLAKLACGLCDNLLTCIVRAWDFHRPLLVSWSIRVLCCPPASDTVYRCCSMQWHYNDA